MSLQLVDVSRRFGSQLALDRVSLHVRRGDCYGFIGHNGAGKTTAIRIALGLDRSFTGAVRIDGFDAEAHPREARARLGGLVEVPGFHDNLAGARNLELLARLQGFGRVGARRETARVLELVGLSDVGEKPVRAYSHGMRQRLGIAQSLLGTPAYVLLDEPTNGLDPEGIAQMRELLQRLTHGEGLTVLLSSHQLAQLSGLCNRIGVVHRGRLLVEEETERLLGGEDQRYALRLGDGPLQPERIAAALSALAAGGVGVEPGLGSERDTAGAREFQLQLGARPPEETLRTLVELGVPVRAFTPRPATLEEIYLRYAKSEEPAAPAPTVSMSARTGAEPSTPPARLAPPERLAPNGPTRRVIRYELERSWSRGALLALLALPAILAALRIWRRSAHAQAMLEHFEQGQLATTTQVTAFEAVGAGLQAALPLAAVIAAGLASQALAAELSNGTLRNLLLRPVRRAQAAAGKVLALLGLALGTYAALALVALLAAAWAFDYTGLYEILPDGGRYEYAKESLMWPQLGHALVAPLLPLASYVALGFLAGALARGAAGALALALGLVAFLDLSRTIARGLGWEGWLPSAYLPSPLGDTSYLRFYSDVVQGISNTEFAYARTSLVVPAVWTVACLALATWLLSRRSIP
jgi:ABC-type multidrug transport system ATPase subunit/ABC-type transport system involved in multi-copper enzyme maturation permease subunit